MPESPRNEGSSLIGSLLKKPLWKESLRLRWFAFCHVPLLNFVQPRVLQLSSQLCMILIPLTWRTRNHVGSMYFAALAAGADAAVGYLALHLIRARGERVALIFQDFHAHFRKRAEGDVVFICQKGEAIEQLIKDAEKSGERVSLSVPLVAKVNEEVVADFSLTLSLKKKT